MNTLLIGILVLAGAFLFFSMIILLFVRERAGSKRVAALSIEDPHTYARQATIAHLASKKRSSLDWPLSRLKSNFKCIQTACEDLNENLLSKIDVPAPAEWLLDNFYIINSQYRVLRSELRRKDYLRLPVLQSGPYKGYARVYAMAVELIAGSSNTLDDAALTSYFSAYQAKNILLELEVRALPIVLRLVNLEDIRCLCEDIIAEVKSRKRADAVFDVFMKETSKTLAKFHAQLASNILTGAGVDLTFAEHLCYRLRRAERNPSDAMGILEAVLSKHGTSADEVTQMEHSAQSLATVAMENSVKRLHYFSSLDWSALLPTASRIEQVLRTGGDQVYQAMDLPTRDLYKQRISCIAEDCRCSEVHVAREALKLAANAFGKVLDSERTGHVGYYLIDEGECQLESLLTGKKQKRTESNRRKTRWLLYLLAISAISAAIVTLGAIYGVNAAVKGKVIFGFLCAAVLLIPASEIAVYLVNRMVGRIAKPKLLPKLQLKDGIPDELSTMVIIPTLLPSEDRVAEALQTMEEHYLRNRERNLYFAIIGAFGDACSAHLPSDESVMAFALAGIKALNDTYAEGTEIFFFFHRERQYNASNDIWIGWERKRGAIMEFNDLIQGSADTSFVCASSKSPPFGKIRYVITLDSETILPIGMAKRLIGTMAHPLNRPFVDETRRVVTRGYGLIQPHIDIECASGTLFSRIFTNQDATDPYSGALSDVYQDMFGEGIFTGKGIYDLVVFQTVLKGTIPENTVLSHDLLEGSYLRTGLASDLTLVDGFPAQYQAYAARQKRWIRGDWQLLSYVMPAVRSADGNWIKNPLSALSRWKIYDNLRRSLRSPALMLLSLLAMTVLPGSIVVWLGFLLLTIMMPLIGALLSGVLSVFRRNARTKRYMPVVDSLKSALLEGLLDIAFLPYQAWLAVSAIILTLMRVWVTKKNLLEWVTSADSEAKPLATLAGYVRFMQASIWQSIVGVTVVALTRSWEFAVVFLPLMLLWLVSPAIAFAISKETIVTSGLNPADKAELEKTARKTWRYFEEFSAEDTHFLAPDNYQLEPYKGVAARTSPTNIGFGLLATLTARDMGFIGTIELIGLVENTIATIEGLPKWNGHLFNWYDTVTLRPLNPVYVSTVDSGNLTGYLLTLAQGLQEYLDRPLIDIRFFDGLAATVSCGEKERYIAWRGRILQAKDTVVPLGAGSISGMRVMHDALVNWLEELDAASLEGDIWLEKARLQMQAQLTLLEDYFSSALLPRALPKAADTQEDLSELLDLLGGSCAFVELPARLRAASALAGRMHDPNIGAEVQLGPEVTPWLSGVQVTLSQSAEKSLHEVLRCTALIHRIRTMIAAVQFRPLYNEKKKLFSIGYNLEDNKLTNSYYDLLASEARLASYIAIANGEIPAAHWFSMGRTLTVQGRYKGLVSWTGTMFEYLMPLLIMKSYSNTLLDEACSFAVRSQMKFAKTRSMPWGMSESAYNSLDKRNDYQYKAIGIPWLGLKRGLNEDSVVAPYATFLALLVQPDEAVKNIARLKEEHMDGAYGFYEAADFTKDRLYFEPRRVIIKSFMAHHQGMSLLAINEYLNHNRMQERFSKNPAVRAYRHLLQEKVPANIVMTKVANEKVALPSFKFSKQELPVRMFRRPNTGLPRVHMLSNGNYSVMLTDAGTGYSKNKVVAITRWQEDSTLDRFGTFLYLRDVESGKQWSSAYAPLNQMPDIYEVEFADDKAIYRRTDGEVDTKTEVFVATNDNVEIRKLTLENHSDATKTIEITSYCEVVLAPRAADQAHMAFSNLFVETDFHAQSGMISAKRRPRSDKEMEVCLGAYLVRGADQNEEIEFETDRAQFLGRGNDASCPQALQSSQPLSGTVGAVLDPIISLRTRVVIESGKTAALALVMITAGDKEVLLAIAKRYETMRDIELSAHHAYERSRIETKYRDFKASEITLYLNILSHLMFLSPGRRINSDRISQNHRGQSALWRYGISGDLPILLVALTAETQIPLLHEAIKAYEYWGVMDISADMIVIVSEEAAYTSPLRDLAVGIMESYKRYNTMLRPDEIVLLNRKDITQEDYSLLISASRIFLQGGNGTMEAQLSGIAKRHLPEQTLFSKETAVYTPVILQHQELLYDNGIGGFRPDGKEYCIRLEREHTPAPWINVIANPNFGFIVSESGSGYTWRENSHEYRLTPWSNDAVSDPPGEVLYLCDKDTGKIFTPTALPIRDEGIYHIRHGFGYSEFSHSCLGISQTLTQFVPENDALKISRLVLKNEMNETRRLSATYYVRPVLGVSDQVTAMHIQTSMSESGALLMRNPYNEDFPRRICYMNCSVEERTVTGDRKEFFGMGGLKSPDCLKRDCLSGELGIGLDPCGAMQIHLELQPGEERTIVFLLGAADSEREIVRACEEYLDAQRAQEELQAVADGWDAALSQVRVETPDAALNLLQNGWLLYQVIACRLRARTGFYQSGGAFGFRDQLQDILAVAASNPALARGQILRHAKHQFVEGDVQHWWHEPMGSGVRTRFSDDFLWLPYVTAEYTRISGDDSILLEMVPFLQGNQLTEQEHERYERATTSTEEATLYEHCLRAIRRGLSFGAQGLPLMGGGDWNDGMNAVGEKGLGESVWLGWFLSDVLGKFLSVCDAWGDHTLASTLRETRKTLLKAVEEHAWDGGWYTRAYFDDGTALGSIHNVDCKIDSIAQSWSVLSGGGEAERTRKAMQSLEDYLVNRDEGLVKLLTPPFDKGKSEPGYIKGYVPGVRENGGQYTHAAAWAIMAFAKLGEGDKALALYDLINPIHHTSSYRGYAKYKTEPYALPADVYAAWPHMGRGGWSWYTGAAGWLYRAGLESILGIRKEGDHLIINPCILAGWQSYSVEYRFYSATYHIVVRNPNRVQTGVVSMAMDGENLTGAFALKGDAREHWIDVLMG